MNKRRKLNFKKAVIPCLTVLILYMGIVQPVGAQLKAVPKSEKQRIIVLTDIGGDLDDEQSFTRFLMYADQFDIEGLVATSIRIFPKDERRPIDGEPQPQYLVKWINAYSEVRENRCKHSEGCPEPADLLGMIRKGTKTYRDGPFNIRTGIAEESSKHLPLEEILGAGKDTEASLHIIDVVDRDDPRPVWISIWGGSVELAQALWKVRNDRSKKELKQFISKIRVYAWGHQDATGLWILENFPDLFYIVSTGGILYSADPKIHDEEWLNKNVRFDHGPLGALCPVRKGMLGGADSETYLGLIPNGLSVMEHPDWGGWGGRLQLAPGSKSHWIDLESNLNPETLGFTISRWAPEFQNDYQARMDWCVAASYKDANHAPIIKLKNKIDITAKSGEKIKFDAGKSYDPDGNNIQFTWWQFKEAGSYNGTIELQDSENETPYFVAPNVSKTETIHIILKVTDNGSPALNSYQRIIVTVEPK